MQATERPQPVPEDSTRLYIGGLRDDVTSSDIAQLLRAFQPKDIVVTPKGFGFATVPNQQVNKCLSMNKTRWKGQALMIDRAKPHFTARPDPSRPMPRKTAPKVEEATEEPQTEQEPLDSHSSSSDEEHEYDDHENSDSSDEDSPRADPTGEHGVYLGPSREAALTLSQWIWTEDADDKFVRRARKQGWKLQRISTRIKKENMRHKFFDKEDDRSSSFLFGRRPQEELSLAEWYDQRLPYITGEKDFVEKYKPKKKKLEDVWGSSDEEDDDDALRPDAERFESDSRFILDDRFSESKELASNLEQMARWDEQRRRREEEREQRMRDQNQAKRATRYQEYPMEEEEAAPLDEADVTQQIQKERTNALDILASMNLHDPSLTLRDHERRLEVQDEEQEQQDSNEVLWGRTIPRFDPTAEDPSSEEEEMEANDDMEEDAPEPQQAEASSDDEEEAISETESTPAPPKETVVNTSWARATLGGGTWSLFGDTSTTSVDEALLARKNANAQPEDEEMSDDEDSDSSSAPFTPTNTQVVSTTELELGKPSSSQVLRSMKFFGFIDELAERMDESDLFFRQGTMAEIEDRWRDSRKNIITDYKRKSKQAVQKRSSNNKSQS